MRGGTRRFVPAVRHQLLFAAGEAMNFDSERFYATTRPHVTPSGFSWDIVTVFTLHTKVPVTVYNGSFHPEHDFYWEKKFAADLAAGEFDRHFH